MWLRVLTLAVVTIPAVVVGENSSIGVVVNPNKVVNYISKEFVCFSAKPRNVFVDSLNPISEVSFEMAKSLGPMYLKVFGDSSQLQLAVEDIGGRDSELIQITPNGWRAFNEWSQQAGIVPIFVLDYSGQDWKPKAALKMMTVASKLGIKNCLWQLGSGNITNAVKYVEDLRAFQAMVKAFNFWGVVATEVDPEVTGIEQTRYFHLNVDEVADAISVSYEPSTNKHRLKEIVLQRESHLRGPIRSQLPIWLDVKLPITSYLNNGCDENCLQEGLRYATLLGDAARNGFDAVFKALSREEIQTYSFNYLIALLHRSTIGTKVFDATPSAQENTLVYAYCSGNANGSLTLMTVNHHPEDVQLDIRLIVKQHSAEIQQYILTTLNGHILLNGEEFEFGTSVEPTTNIEPVLKGVPLSIPALSVAFWVIPNLNLRECTDDYQELRMKFAKSATEHGNAVDQLLQELIAERVQRDITQISRRKRSLDSGLRDLLTGKLDKELQKRGSIKQARRPRQTKNYRRKQRVVRNKEKRAERKTLKKQKRPLRERGKRQSRNKNPFAAKTTSKKTKRSFMAEAVSQPPLFGDSREEESNHSAFPQGDVHLVISKGSPEESFMSIEQPVARERRPKQPRKKPKVVTKAPTGRDVRFLLPEAVIAGAFESKRFRSDPREMDMAESIKNDRYIPLNTPETDEMFSTLIDQDEDTVEVSNIKIVESKSAETTPETIKDDNFHEVPLEEFTDNNTKTAVTPVVEEIDESSELEDEDEIDIFTDSPEYDGSMSTDESEEIAHVEELNRKKRSSDSSELDQIEAFFMNNTKLQQKFTELFELLLESFDCCNASDENTAREQWDETTSEQQVQRAKRNVLLHPQSWESRERSNMLHQQRTSAESHENMIPTEPVTKAMSSGKTTSASFDYKDDESTSTSETGQEGTGRSDAVMLQSVTNFLKKLSTGFHKIFSLWLPKTAME